MNYVDEIAGVGGQSKNSPLPLGHGRLDGCGAMFFTAERNQDGYSNGTMFAKFGA